MSLSPSVRADFETIRSNIDIEARLIDNLLDVTGISRGKLPLEMDACDVHAAVKDAVASVQESAKTKEIRIACELAAPRHIVWGDRMRLRQIFFKVLTNAVVHTPKGGSIRVETATGSQAERIAVRVTDSGVGMTAVELAGVFGARERNAICDDGIRHYRRGLGPGSLAPPY